jgi:hypothetical protein
MLPNMPPDPPVNRRKTPPGIRATRYKPRTRQLCSQCTALIHEVGVARAPLPSPVRWRVSVGALTVLLCETHKNETFEAMST